MVQNLFFFSPKVTLKVSSSIIILNNTAPLSFQNTFFFQMKILIQLALELEGEKGNIEKLNKLYQ